jgi:cardiolipin synthase (CMP-forming)
MTLANIITISRIGLIPVFAFFVLYYADGLKKGKPVEWEYYVALALFITIAVTDGMDGYVARKYNQKTKLGSILDPLADKTLLLTTLIILSINPGDAFPQMPIWFIIVLLSRDLILLMGVIVIFMMGKMLEVTPHWIGKVATLFQMLTIGMVLLRLPEHYWNIPLWAAGIFTAVSGVIYVVQGSKKLGA